MPIMHVWSTFYVSIILAIGLKLFITNAHLPMPFASLNIGLDVPQPNKHLDLDLI